MITLGIDTSNTTMAVVLFKENQLLAEYTSTNKKNHSVGLMPAIDFLLKENQLVPHDLEEIIIASGPGSYTGLRIGVTTAKTLAWTLKLNLFSVSSLATIAATSSQEFKGLIIPLINARRQNVYTGIYQWENGELIKKAEDCHIALIDWLTYLNDLNEEVVFIGEDAALFEQLILEILPATKIITTSLSARKIIETKTLAKPIESIDAFTPNYLKLVEAEENWLKNHKSEETSYVERV